MGGGRALTEQACASNLLTALSTPSREAARVASTPHFILWEIKGNNTHTSSREHRTVLASN